MAHHKRGKPKKQRGHAGQGCLICYYQKQWKMNGVRKEKYRPSERRRTQESGSE